MCKNCKASSLGIERQAALDAAIAECQRLNINPGTSGFIARHALYGHTPQFTEEQQAALVNYNTARSLMKSLHNDFIFEQEREAAQQRLARMNAGRRDFLLEYAIAFDAGDNVTMAAVLDSVPLEQRESFDAALTTLHNRMDGERTACEYIRAMREESER